MGSSPLIEKVPSTPLPTILNFRDIGQTIYRLHGSSLLREGLIYRSARPDDASPTDRSSLTSQYHIKTIIDLRSTTELIDQAKKHNAKTHPSADAPTSEHRAAEALRVDGVRYHEINLNGGAFARALLWKLRWSSLARLISLMALGYRNEAISILGREVMAPRGLTGLGKDTLDHSFSELYQIFSILADLTNYPIMIHCTQGKDRTGLVVILLLLLLQVPLEAISADYMASERELATEKDSRMKEIRGVGLGEEFAGCPEGFVQDIASHINDAYGDLNGYLKRIGIDAGMQRRIWHNFRGESG